MLKFLKRLIIAGVLVAFVLGGGFLWLVSSPLALSAEKVDFHISPGSGMRAVAKEIAGAGVRIDPWVVVSLGKVLRAETAIKAG